MLAEAIVHFGYVLPIPHWFAKNDQLVETTQDEDSEENSDENEEGSDDEVKETPRPCNPNAKSRQWDRLKMLSCWARNMFGGDFLTELGAFIQKTGNISSTDWCLCESMSGTRKTISNCLPVLQTILNAALSKKCHHIRFQRNPNNMNNLPDPEPSKELWKEHPLGKNDVESGKNLPLLFEPDAGEEEFECLHEIAHFEIGCHSAEPEDRELSSLKQVMELILVSHKERDQRSVNLLEDCVVAFCEMCSDEVAHMAVLEPIQRACHDIFRRLRNWDSAACATFPAIQELIDKLKNRNKRKKGEEEKEDQPATQPPKKKKKRGNAKPKKLVISRELFQNDAANCGKNFHKDSTPGEKKEVLEAFKQTLCQRLVQACFLSAELDIVAKKGREGFSKEASERTNAVSGKEALLGDVASGLIIPTVEQLVEPHTNTGFFGKNCKGLDSAHNEHKRAPWSVNAWDGNDWKDVKKEIEVVLDQHKPTQAALRQQAPGPQQPPNQPDDGNETSGDDNDEQSGDEDNQSGDGEKGSENEEENAAGHGNQEQQDREEAGHEGSSHAADEHRGDDMEVSDNDFPNPDGEQVPEEEQSSAEKSVESESQSQKPPPKNPPPRSQSQKSSNVASNPKPHVKPPRQQTTTAAAAKVPQQNLEPARSKSQKSSNVASKPKPQGAGAPGESVKPRQRKTTAAAAKVPQRKTEPARKPSNKQGSKQHSFSSSEEEEPQKQRAMVFPPPDQRRATPPERRRAQKAVRMEQSRARNHNSEASSSDEEPLDSFRQPSSQTQREDATLLGTLIPAQAQESPAASVVRRRAKQPKKSGRALASDVVEGKKSKKGRGK